MIALEGQIAAAFIAFCRVGACLMIAPGFSTESVPIRFRLYLALSITIALSPSSIVPEGMVSEPGSLTMRLGVASTELLAGATLGLLARFYFFAIESLMTSVALSFGLGNIFASPLLADEAAPALATYVTLSALGLAFAADLHLEIIRGLYHSFQTAPIGSAPGPGAILSEVTNVLTQSHLEAMRICSPFLAISLIINLALGFLARLSPQIQIYFLSGPLVVLVGIYAFSTLASDFFTAFEMIFASSLSRI